MKKVSSRPKVVSKGKKPPASGVTKGKKPQKTAYQKELDKWPPKPAKKNKKGKK